jgi:HlyD family secretion protein
MDIQRKGIGRKKRIRRIIYGTGGLVLVLLITLGLSRLEPAAPSVERATVWMDTVKRGEMIRQVRGTGTLVPEEIRWIPAVTEGRVERRVVLPGAEVKPDTIILELSNPELVQTALAAEMDLKRSEAEYANLRIQLESQAMAQRAGAAAIEAEYIQAKLQAESNQELADSGLISKLIVRQSTARANSLTTRHQLEQQRLAIVSKSVEAQLEAKRAEVEQRRALYNLRRRQVQALRVRAGIAGILQQLPVEVGQQVTPGFNLARVAVPEQLKAELRIPETQARDIQIGLPVSIDTRNGVVAGRVMRVDPAAQGGTVTVDVSLERPYPRGTRPNLSVDGTIELERLEDVLYVGRPAYGQPNSTVGLFKLLEDGKTAVRVRVKLGRGSVTTFEIVEGLQVGDQVILSDTSAWDAFDRIRLN